MIRKVLPLFSNWTPNCQSHCLETMQSIIWWATVIAVTIATVCDLRSRRIPNWLVFPFFLAGLSFSTVARGWSGLAYSIGGALLAALLLGLFHFLGGMGMGDLKLCASIGAWIGPHQLLFALAFMGLTGGTMVFVWALSCGFCKEMVAGTGDLIFGLGKRRLGRHETLVLTSPAARKMPYAPAIAVGTVLSFFARP